MPKNEKEPQIEVGLEPRYPFDQYEKIYRDVCDEVCDLLTGIKADAKWLIQHCQEHMNDFYEADPPDLIELRNTLQEIRNQLRRQSYSLLYGSKETQYFYGEISEYKLNG